jgi:predicted amidophosphoribosyltransferase
LVAAPDRYLPGGLVVKAAFLHTGPARALVHRLKYEGIRPAAELLATALVERWGPFPDPLVPIPRAAIRVWRFGVDPALELAWAMAAISGAEVRTELRAPLWASQRAGRRGTDRRPPRFSTRRVPTAGVLVDDVLTTGTTLCAAASALGAGPGLALVATAAPAATRLQPDDGGPMRTRLGAVTGGPEDGHETPWGGRWWR